MERADEMSSGNASLSVSSSPLFLLFSLTHTHTRRRGKHLNESKVSYKLGLSEVVPVLQRRNSRHDVADQSGRSRQPADDSCVIHAVC